jgi:hypothetical protein
MLEGECEQECEKREVANVTIRSRVVLALAAFSSFTFRPLTTQRFATATAPLQVNDCTPSLETHSVSVRAPAGVANRR